MFRLSSFLRSQFVPHRKLFICLDCRISFVLSSYRTVNSVHMFILSHFLRSQFVPHGKHFISVKKNNKGNMLSMNLKLTYVPLKCLLSLSCFKQNQKVTSKFSKNREKINVLEILCGCNRAVSCGRADVRTCGRTWQGWWPFSWQLLSWRAELLDHATWQATTNTTFSLIFKRVSVIAAFHQVQCERTVLIACWQTDRRRSFLSPATLWH